ncbi:MAG: alanine racemase [Desulfobacterales bacterium]|nr:alanine racemase [Desulfobacterales bacterium]
MNSPLIWAEIDLKAIAHNISALRNITNPNAKLMAVVKANAYGHGMKEIAFTALKHGAETLGVARINEGIQLRKWGIESNILIFGFCGKDDVKDIIEFNLTPTIFSIQMAKELSNAAACFNKKIKTHIKIDTGMGRLGLVHDSLRLNYPNSQSSLIKDIALILKNKNLFVEGIYTHFATADSQDKSFAKMQLDLFFDCLEKLKYAGIDIPIKHAANSAATIELPEAHFDMVRLGISLYGLYPSNEINKKNIDLKPALSLKSKIIQLKHVPKDFTVSYGCTYKTSKPSIIATVPVGYADGYNRNLSSKGYMLVKGKRANIAGRVCMDITMLDVSHIPDIEIGDEVVIYGEQCNECISVDEVAENLHTINYEIVSIIATKVPRVYSC